MKKILSFLVVLTMILSCAAIPAMADTLQVGDSIVIDAVTSLGTSEYTEYSNGGSWSTVSNAAWVTNDNIAGVRMDTKNLANSYVIFTPASGKLPAGTYKVEWWNMVVTTVSGSNTTTGNYQYDVSYNGGTETGAGTFAPRSTDAGWYSLGEYEFTGNGSETVKITNLGTNGRFAVDSIRLTLVSLAETGEAETVIIDAVDSLNTSEYTEYTNGGTWETKTNTFWVTNDNVAGVRVDKAATQNSYVIFTPASGKLPAGTYKVEWWNMYVTGYSSNNTPSSDYQYDIAYNGGTETGTGTFAPKTATGTTSGWYSLGEYEFTGNGSETVKITNLSSAGRFAVDAIRFTPVESSGGDSGDEPGSEPDEPTNTGITVDEDGAITIDDAAACFVTGGTTSTGATVSWAASTNAAFTDHDGGSVSIMLEGTGTKASAGANAVITPAEGLITAGDYEVKWWNMRSNTASGGAKEVTYEICCAGGTSTVSGTFVPDSATAADGWYSVGKYPFTGNGSEYIKFTRSSASAGRFSADALQLVPTTITATEVMLSIDKTGKSFTSEFAGSGDTTWSFKNNSFFEDYDGANATMLAAETGVPVVKAQPNAYKLAKGVYEVYWYNMVDNTYKDLNNGEDVIISVYGPAEVDYKVVCNGGDSEKIGSFAPITATGGEAGWISLGKCYFTGNGEEYIEITNNSGEGRLAANAVKFVPVSDNSDSLLVYNLDFIKDGAIADTVTAGNYTAYMEGYIAIPQQTTAKIIIAKYDNVTDALVEVKYEETSTEIKNTATLSVAGAIEIATPIITVSENEDVTLKLFLWKNDGSLTPLFPSKSITTQTQVTE